MRGGWGVSTRHGFGPRSTAASAANNVHCRSPTGIVGGAPPALLNSLSASPVAPGSLSVTRAVNSRLFLFDLLITVQATWTNACENSPKSPMLASKRTSPLLANCTRHEVDASWVSRLAGKERAQRAAVRNRVQRSSHKAHAVIASASRFVTDRRAQ